MFFTEKNTNGIWRGIERHLMVNMLHNFGILTKGFRKNEN